MSRQVSKPGPSGQRHRMAHPWLTAEAFARLEEAARKRAEHPDVLAALILETVLLEDLVGAVLDGDTLLSVKH